VSGTTSRVMAGMLLVLAMTLTACGGGTQEGQRVVAQPTSPAPAAPPASTAPAAPPATTAPAAPPATTAPAAPPAGTPRTGEVSIFDVEVGMCYDDQQTTTVEGINSVPCTQTHLAEIYALIDHPAGPSDPFIGSEAMSQFATEVCEGQAFTDFIGIPYLDSAYYATPIFPTEGTWADGDREVICSVVTSDGSPLPNQSLRGIRQ
jgi:Septum formation